MPGEIALLSPTTRRKMQQDLRNEKKLIDQKVAAVREIVSTASNNDIVLALHNFDMDVSRTIQAFCEDGAQTALDSWQSSGLATKKKQRRKKTGADSAAMDGDAGSTASSTSAVFTSSNAATIGSSSFPSHTAETTLSSGPSSLVNGDLSSTYGYGPPTTEIVKAALHSAAPKSQRTQQQQRSAVSNNTNNHRSSQPVVNGRGAKHGPIGSERYPPSSNSANQSPILNGNDDHLNPADKKKALAKELKNLGRHDAVVEHVHSCFNVEMDKARDRMRRAFQEVRQRIAERESHLAAELERCKEDGQRLLMERNVKGKELHQRADRIAAMSDRELNELRAEIKTFVAERRYEEELGQAIRFQWEPEHILPMIKNFGEVVPVKSISAQKHSSHSSLVSSVGEDSGLGMVSPVSPATEAKPMAQVTGGGIEMKSDALTADQLEDLNRRLQDSLRAQGIDVSVLDSVGGTTAMPVRRRPPAGAAGGRGRGGRGGGGRGGRSDKHQHAPPPMRQPELSIFQD